ncbi:DUF739 family protein [Macrococcus brunensis]|nr:DUF739 family protein [Macrococcus brunensis]
MEEVFDYEKLRSRMKECGFSQDNLAKSASIGRTSLSLKLNNKVAFTQTDMRRISKVLFIAAEEIGPYFFTPLVQKTELKGRGG